ncbi:ThuA domain-containing protein [Aestuariicella hydrocarbonica]|uniref:ThuA domain-containing protein n=1 Tax=Pseudomaricurvus hydrocarbonicus TaxID=1470433 RepID=A0A9E5JWC9_9GAMM|nr:ThuA domain-containing protein [Aestuariicella hydrocarbonica]NHO66793.1 ThuA domain-containing protein [Aestuariicella hydrocarbonica]
MLKLTIRAALIASLCITGLVSAGTQASINCPLANQPFSLDMPLSDAFRNETAKQLIHQYAPNLGHGLTASFGGGDLPESFANIMSPRLLLSFEGISLEPKQLAALERQLQEIPVTQVDRTQRCQRYDNDRPTLPEDLSGTAVLVFQKITGFRDEPSVQAAATALRTLAKRHGWKIVFSEQGGVFNPQDLARFDTLIWNNVSGDALTLEQRQAFKDYLSHGGGFVGIHGSGGDPVYFWDWYADDVIGARFIGHPADPQFQMATVKVENHHPVLSAGLPDNWSMNEEWYSFRASQKKTETSVVADKYVVASLDESTYSPKGFGGQDLSMGDHPIAWAQCLAKGRVFYTAIGHLAENYTEPNSARLLENGILWSLNQDQTSCQQSLQIDQ